MKQHECRQFGDSVGVVHEGEETEGACVLISRSVGNAVARALMRLSRDVLNGDYDAARDELEQMEHRGYRLTDQPIPDPGEGDG